MILTLIFIEQVLSTSSINVTCDKKFISYVANELYTNLLKINPGMTKYHLSPAQTNCQIKLDGKSKEYKLINNSYKRKLFSLKKEQYPNWYKKRLEQVSHIVDTYQPSNIKKQMTPEIAKKSRKRSMPQSTSTPRKKHKTSARKSGKSRKRSFVEIKSNFNSKPRKKRKTT